MSDRTCYFCNKPLGEVYTYHWSNAVHEQCKPIEEEIVSEDDFMGLVEEVGFYLRALDAGRPYGTERMRHAHQRIVGKIDALSGASKLLDAATRRDTPND